MSTRLDLTHQGLTRLPDDLPRDTEILDLSGNHLSDLPESLRRLDRLRIIFLSGNPLGRLPTVLGSLPHLTMIGAKSCGLTEVPAEALPPHLRWLILTDNTLTALPEALGQRPALEKLALAGNHLTHLPNLRNCANLALLRLGANPLESLPTWLANLPRLAWLGFGGSPLTRAQEDQPRDLTAVPWDDLRLGEVLGQGASGIIHRADLRGQSVAVKLFKGAITSDGSPTSEQAAWIAAGPHAHRIGLLGRLEGHPQGVSGLIMPLVPPQFRRLGDPPSFATCSRDTFPPDLRLDPLRVARIARGFAEALADLHARGLLHGDAYAHNVLEDGQGLALLGDFGAATFTDDRRYHAVEVRALACLLDDLLERCSAGTVTDRLRHLQQACDAPTVSQRPTMAEAAELLRSLTA